MALGIFHIWLFLEGKRETSFSPPSIFSPIRFYLNISSIHFRVLLYHGSRPLLHVFLSFSLTYNYNHAFWNTKLSTHSSPNWLKIEDFFPPLNSWCCAWLCLMGLKLHKWMKNCLDNRL
jgi:hypothetical protein